MPKTDTTTTGEAVPPVMQAKINEVAEERRLADIILSIPEVTSEHVRGLKSRARGRQKEKEEIALITMP